MFSHLPRQAGAGGQRLQQVDVEAVLAQLASKKGGGGNWRTSIVDLLKLLDLDSSLAARKDLANELNVVRVKRLWPRSFLGSELTEGDRRAAKASAERDELFGDS